MAKARGQALTDDGAARGVLVKIQYIGDDRRTRAYVAEGKPYFFGVNKPINAIPARVVPQFLDPTGRYFGAFERVSAESVSPESMAPPTKKRGGGAANSPEGGGDGG